VGAVEPLFFSVNSYDNEELVRFEVKGKYKVDYVEFLRRSTATIAEALMKAQAQCKEEGCGGYFTIWGEEENQRIELQIKTDGTIIRIEN